MATSSYGFNSRLNLSGVKRELFDGFISNSMFSFCQNVYSFGVNSSTKAVTISTGAFDSGDMKMRIYIRENGEVYYVENEPFYYAPSLRCFVDSSNWQLTTQLSDGSKHVTTYDFSAGTKTVTRYDSNGNVTSTETFSNRYKPTAWGSWRSILIVTLSRLQYMTIRNWCLLPTSNLTTFSMVLMLSSALSLSVAIPAQSGLCRPSAILHSKSQHITDLVLWLMSQTKSIRQR